MRRQWPCSKCGFACSSTWRSMNPTKPVVCNSCKSRVNSSNSGATNSSKQAVVAETTDSPVSCELKPSTLSIKENNADHSKVDSGLFVFATSISDPVRIDQREPTSKGKGKAVASGDGQSSVGIEDPFHLSLNPSTLFENHIHEEINEEALAKKLVVEEIKKVSSFWNVAGNVKKKKRTKIPQFKPSPMERFFNQLYNIKKEQDQMVNNKSCPDEEDKHRPLHDDLFVYQKCNLIPENEIGLGAMLLPLPSKGVGEPRSLPAAAKEVVVVVKSEPSEFPPQDSIEVCCSMTGVKKSSSE